MGENRALVVWGIRIDGMTCTHCALAIERAFRQVSGVLRAEVSFDARQAWVLAGADVKEADLRQAVEGAGYKLVRADRRVPKWEGQARRSQFDLVVLGGGSAAFAAAIRAAELGARVLLVERGTIGGTCVNVGCIPSKALLRAAEAVHRCEHLPFAGVQARLEGLAYDKLVRQKNELVASLRKAKYLDVLAAYPTVELRSGEAKFADGAVLSVDGEEIACERVVIATGARAWIPPIPGLDKVSYLTSTEALALEELPRSLVVLGGSAVGLELGQMFSRFGVNVTVLEVLPRVLPQEDEDASTALRECLQAEGLTIHTNARVQRVQRVAKGVSLSVLLENTSLQIEADQLLVATGRRPNTASLGLDSAGIIVGPRGEVEVNAFLETSRAGVYAAGDVLGDPMFVYVAAYTGSVAAENALLGNLHPVVLTTVPRVTFTDPAVASVGMTESRARELGEDVMVATLPLKHVPRALVSQDTRGLIKVVASRDSRRLLGVHIVAAEAGEMIQEASMAMRFGIRVDELAAALHPYLTYSEGIKLACQSLEKDVANLSCCAA